MIIFYDARSLRPLPFDPDGNVAGWLPAFFDERDPRSAREQLEANYAHGGGWRPYTGFRYTAAALYGAGDPPMPVMAYAKLRDEQLRLYRGAWLAIVQPDGSVEIARCD